MTDTPKVCSECQFESSKFMGHKYTPHAPGCSKEKKLNWKNLKDNACPMCMGMLEKTPTGYRCSHADPTVFAKPCQLNEIPTEKFNDIIKDLYKPKSRATQVDNQEALNNL